MLISNRAPCQVPRTTTGLQSMPKLGLHCSYGFRLTWQNPLFATHGRAGAKSGATKPTLQVYNCIFLNVTLKDFQRRPRKCRPSVTEGLGLTDHGGHSTVMPSSHPPSHARMPPSVTVELPPVRISSQETRLLDYFTNFIAPKCATDTGINPFLK